MSSLEAKRQNIHTLLHTTMLVVKENNSHNLSDEHSKPSMFTTTEVDLKNFSWYCKMPGFKFNSKCELFLSRAQKNLLNFKLQF